MNGYKTYLLSLLGGLTTIIAGSQGAFGQNSPIITTLITTSWAALAAYRHGQKTDAEKQAIKTAELLAKNVEKLLIQKGIITQANTDTVQQDAQTALIDGNKLISAIQTLMKPAPAAK